MANKVVLVVVLIKKRAVNEIGRKSHHVVVMHKAKL
jgi:hypothetical protein